MRGGSLRTRISNQSLTPGSSGPPLAGTQATLTKRRAWSGSRHPWRWLREVGQPVYCRVRAGSRYLWPGMRALTTPSDWPAIGRQARDSAMRVIPSRRASKRHAASTNTLSRFQTEVLTRRRTWRYWCVSTVSGRSERCPHTTPASGPGPGQLGEPGAPAAGRKGPALMLVPA